MKALLTLLTLLVLYTGGLAQTTLTGRVLTADQQPLEFATVMLLNPTDSSLVKGAVTELNGEYVLPQISAGTYLLSVSMMGYEKLVTGPHTIGAGATQTMAPVTLAELTESLETVTVTGTRPLIVQEADRTVVNVEGSILASGGNALEVLQRAPGVIVDRDENINLNGKQGVIIMIDGKRTRLSGAEVANLLRNLPSDAVERVEIITNPSAKYEAEGNAGIIDIRTKKGQNDGFNGSATLGSGYGRYEKANGGINLNLRQNKFNYYGNANYNYGRRFNETILNREVNFQNQNILFNQANTRPSSGENLNFKLGADFYATQKTTLGVMVNGTLGNWQADLTNNTFQTTNHTADTLEHLVTSGLIRNDMQNYSFNTNFLHKFNEQGQELTADVEYTLYVGNKVDRIENDVRTGAATSLQNIFSSTPSDINILVGKVDYTLPIPEGKLEFGAKSSWVSTDNDVRFDTLNFEGVYQPDYTKTNHYLYSERINAAYANWSRKFDKLSLQGGLRAEHTWYRGNSLTTQQVNQRDYLQLFPSVFVQYAFNQTHTAGINYSRRIDRPSYNMLNPFIYLLDKYTYFQGNPALQPQFTNQLQANYTYKQQYNVSISYSHTDQVYTQVPERIFADDDRYTIATMMNLAELDNISLNVNFPVDITKWWSLQNNLGIFKNHYRGQLLGEALNAQQTSYNANIMNRFSLPHGISAELGGFYNSPEVYGAMQSEPMYAINAGLQYSFWNKAGSVKLNVNDIFNTMQWQGSQDFGGIKFNILNKWESRQARLTFSYNFGDTDLKPARRHRSASDEEKSRLGGQN